MFVSLRLVSAIVPETIHIYDWGLQKFQTEEYTCAHSSLLTGRDCAQYMWDWHPTQVLSNRPAERCSGSMNFTCTSSSLSELDAIMTPSHQCWSYMHVMYCPGFMVVGCGQSWLAFVEGVWLTDPTEKLVRQSSDTRLTFNVELSIGRKQWCSRVPGTVLAFINRAVCSSACPLISSWDTYRQWMPLTLASAQPNSFFGVRIWSSTAGVFN